MNDLVGLLPGILLAWAIATVIVLVKRRRNRKS
jgi:hypothetical protein